MAAKTSDSQDTISDINIVPLVDIILVVLIIFMVTAPALMKPSVKVNLPEAASGEASQPTLLAVTVTPDERILINNQEVDEDGARRIATEEFERNPEVQAVIAADRDVPYGLVIRVMDWIKSAGVKNLAVTTDKPLEGKL
jgi:biopolymer transport protein ExbD